MTNTPKHTFRPFQGDPTICVLCGKTEQGHNSEGNCQVCGNIGGTVKYTPKGASGPIFYCQDCLDKEHKAEYAQRYEQMSPDERVSEMNSDWKARALKSLKDKLDQEISVKTDIFNAEIPALLSLKAQVDADSSIPLDKKDYAYTKLVESQLDHLADVVFPSLKTAEELITSRMKGIQQYLNDFVKRLTAEERATIKTRDLTYQPKVTTPKVTVPKAPKAPKFDREGIERVIKEFGYLDMSSVRSLCVSFNKTPDELAADIRTGKLGKK